MVTITPAAAERVKEIIQQQGKGDHALRLFVQGMSCSGPAYGMALDPQPREDDLTTEVEGIRIVIDPMSAQFLEGAEVDFVDTLMGRGFTVRNPNLSFGGGCGGGCSCGHGH